MYSDRLEWHTIETSTKKNLYAGNYTTIIIIIIIILKIL
jgi:hypothetical protein